jgi:predicted transcriptional regulator
MGRHKLEGTHRQYQIEQLWDVHHEVVRLALIGMKQVDIASHLGVSPVMVSYTLRSPIVRDQLNNMHSARDIDAIDISKEIKALAPVAVKVLEELLEHDLPNIKLKAAQDVLDRAGFAAVKTIQTANIHAHLTKEDIDDIKRRAKEIGLCSLNEQSALEYIDAETV